MSNSLALCLYGYRSAFQCMSVCQSVCLSECLSVCLSVSLSVCQSVFLYCNVCVCLKGRALWGCSAAIDAVLITLEILLRGLRIQINAISRLVESTRENARPPTVI